MNTLEQQAKAFVVRDRQVVIQQRSEVEEKMTVEKINRENMEDLAKLRHEEELKRQQAIRQREMLKQACDIEIKRKEQQKLLEEEAKLREGEIFKERQKKQMELEMEEMMEHQAEIQRINVECAKINEQAVQKKKQAIEDEKALDAKIAEKLILEQAKIIEADKRKAEAER